jgi:hypothetical protein
MQVPRAAVALLRFDTSVLQVPGLGGLLGRFKWRRDLKIGLSFREQSGHPSDRWYV